MVIWSASNMPINMVVPGIQRLVPGRLMKVISSVSSMLINRVVLNEQSDYLHLIGSPYRYGNTYFFEDGDVMDGTSPNDGDHLNSL
jgi:hypothetical protein